MSKVTLLPKVKSKRGGITHDQNSIQLGEVPKKVTFAEPESKVTDSALQYHQESKIQYDTCSSFSNVTSDSESSDKDGVLTDSLTSHTTASDSTGTKSSFLPQ